MGLFVTMAARNFDQVRDDLRFRFPLTPCDPDLTQYNNCLTLRMKIPFTFQGTNTDVMVMLAIVPSYPTDPPHCFLILQEGTFISQPHPYIEPQFGFIGLPFLREWCFESNLVLLFSALSHAFSETSPIFKPISSPPPQPTLPISLPIPPTPTIPVPETRVTKEVVPPKTWELVEQKASAQLHKLIDDLIIEVTVDHDLKARERALLNEMQLMLVEREALHHQIEELEEQIKQAEEWTKEADQVVIPENADELIVPADQRTEQLLELCATDRTIMDMEFHLDKALENRVISVADWLKTMRAISKDLYKARGLIRKIVSTTHKSWCE
eukprot:c8251_g1_i2.p1 GENE.c8251_g1_i2~~c8251_g1_i2.p1  ORF type:complete len:326 (-),score=58.36 c8251_g1_i2:33-1010(-)